MAEKTLGEKVVEIARAQVDCQQVREAQYEEIKKERDHDRARIAKLEDR